MKVFNKVVMVLVLAAMVFSACTTATPEVVEKEVLVEVVVTATPQPTKILKIGVDLPLTGTLFREGEGLQRGYSLWAEEVNRRGGIKVGEDQYLVQLVYYDDKSDPGTAAQLAEKLIIQDEVDFIFGPYGSGLTVAVAAVTERYGRVFIQPSGNADSIYEAGYEHLFGLIKPASHVLKPIVEMVHELDPEAKRVAILYKDDVFATWIAKGAGERAVELGMEVVFDDMFPVDTQDFSTLLTQMQATDPDLLIVPGHSADAAQIVAQMRDLNINVKAIGHAITLEDMRDALGEDANYLCVVQFWSPFTTWQGDFFGSAQDFDKLYREKYGVDAYSVPAQAAAAGVIFMNAVEMAGSLDQVALETALRSMDIETFFGPVSYNELGINMGAQTQVLQLQNGVVELVWPPEGVPEGNKPIYPMPEWDER